MTTTFSTKILGFGNNTGIEVPAENLAELGAGKRAPVVVHLGKYSYKSTVGVMNGQSLISLPKAHREASGLQAGDEVSVVLELDAGQRSVDMPPELTKKLLQNPEARSVFDGLAYSHRKEFARWIGDAKKPETKQKRLDKAIEMILDIKQKGSRP